MFAVNIIQFGTLFFAGLLAGFEIAVHYGIATAPRGLNAAGQILLRQALIVRLRIMAPALFFPAFVFGLVLTIQQRHSPALWLDGTAMVLFGVWIVVRIFRTIPVNSATMEWNPDSPPADWRKLVGRAERFHVFAAWGSVIAFACFLLGALRFR